jgi:hypothetical protein
MKSRDIQAHRRKAYSGYNEDLTYPNTQFDFGACCNRAMSLEDRIELMWCIHLKAFMRVEISLDRLLLRIPVLGTALVVQSFSLHCNSGSESLTYGSMFSGTFMELSITTIWRITYIAPAIEPTSEAY